MMTAAPPWLQDEPEINALLSAILDRFDDQPGETRTRAITIPVAWHLASLVRGDAQADQVWEFVRELERSRVLIIRYARRNAYDPEWQGAKVAVPLSSEATLRQWLGRPAAPAPLLQWRRAVESHAHRFPGGHAALLTRRIVVPGRAPCEVVEALAKIGEIDVPATLRQLSTHAFWGDSKLLDDRADLIAALFPALRIRERPIVMAVHLPATVRGVLFIENPDTYTAAIAGQPASSADHALIYMAGFGGAAARIRTREGVSLHFGGPGRRRHDEQFEGWWFDGAAFPGNVALWGDLDFSGMQILKSLRARFATVTAWRPGYEPMVERRRSAGISAQRDADLRKQIDPGSTGCDFADGQLLPVIRDYGFWHQEWLAVP